MPGAPPSSFVCPQPAGRSSPGLRISGARDGSMTTATSVELCRRAVERLGLRDPHLRRCPSRPGEVLAGAGGAIHYPALTAAIPAAPTRGSFAQNNRSADCDADRRHAGRRSEQMPQGPTFVPKGADLYQTAAMRSGSVKSTLLSGPVFDGGLEGSASARGKGPTPLLRLFFASSAASKAGACSVWRATERRTTDSRRRSNG